MERTDVAAPSSLVAVFVRLGWTHLSTRPGRTLLTILGVGLGVAATIAVQTANVDVLRSFEESVLTVAGPVTLEVSAGEAGMDERLSQEYETLPESNRLDRCWRSVFD